ncbi:Uncharacterised protein [Mycobacteroides abscessus subsp. abscessus]|nr:Uncharacterised protein [Mycobacteroides abscessus subsp. abscessus]
MASTPCTGRSERTITSRAIRAEDSMASMISDSKFSCASNTSPCSLGSATAVLDDSCSLASRHSASSAASPAGSCGCAMRPEAICCSRISESR